MVLDVSCELRRHVPSRRRRVPPLANAADPDQVVRGEVQVHLGADFGKADQRQLAEGTERFRPTKALLDASANLDAGDVALATRCASIDRAAPPVGVASDVRVDATLFELLDEVVHIVCAPITFSIAESSAIDAHPPYSKPPRRSSSGRAGPCMTPSSVRCSITTILLIHLLVRREAKQIGSFLLFDIRSVAPPRTRTGSPSTRSAPLLLSIDVSPVRYSIQIRSTVPFRWVACLPSTEPAMAISLSSAR